MTTSKKIMAIAAAVALALLVAGLLALRNDLSKLVGTAAPLAYKEVAAAEFSRIDVSSGWSVRITQGRVPKVEVAGEGGQVSEGLLEEVDGTFYFRADTTAAKLLARVTVLNLKEIKADRNAKIHLEGFKTDTLSVELNGGLLSGMNNQITFMSIKSDESMVQWTDDPMN